MLFLLWALLFSCLFFGSFCMGKFVEENELFVFLSFLFGFILYG